MNKEEASRYVEVSRCDFLVDTMIAGKEDSVLEPLFGANLDKWKPIVAREVIDPEASNPLCRAFYIPIVSRWCTKYVSYLVLQAVAK